jgi:hypothetical protein
VIPRKAAARCRQDRGSPARAAQIARDDDAVGVAAIRHAAAVLVREVVGEGEVRAELLEAGLALWTSAVRVHQAAHRGQVAGLELGNCGPNLGDAADNLVPRNAWIDGRHHAAPLIARLVKIGVADAAEENLDLHVVVGGIAPRDRGGSKRRCCAGNGEGFCLVHFVPSTFSADVEQVAHK